MYALVEAGILNRIGRGKFALGQGRKYIPPLSNQIKKLNRDIQKHFPFTQSCIWNTSLFNEFMLHQPGRFYTLIEVDKAATQSVFYFLKEMKKDVYLEPDANLLTLYATGADNIMIVTSLVSEAPVQHVEGVRAPMLEKLLVDIFCNDVFFAPQQGSEMNNIFKEALEKYTLSENKMIRYADRRRKKAAFLEYLNNMSKFRQQMR